MNPILAFYRQKQFADIEGVFSCESCNKATYEAVYEIAKKKTFWVCKHCEHENTVEGTEMSYE